MISFNLQKLDTAIREIKNPQNILTVLCGFFFWSYQIVILLIIQIYIYKDCALHREAY